MMNTNRQSLAVVALVLLSLPLTSAYFTLGKGNIYVKEYGVRMEISPSDMCINVDEICESVVRFTESNVEAEANGTGARGSGRGSGSGDVASCGSGSAAAGARSGGGGGGGGGGDDGSSVDRCNGAGFGASAGDVSASANTRARTFDPICNQVKKAIASLHGYYAVYAKIRVAEDRNGNINNVRLKALAESGALAVTSSFSNSTTTVASTAGSLGLDRDDPTVVDTDEATGSAFGILSRDSGLARASSSAGSLATADATSFAESRARGGAGATASQFAGVFVRGKQIKRFGGYLYTVTGAFSATQAASSSNAEATSVAELVSSVIVGNNGDEITGSANVETSAVAQAAGEAVAKALGSMVVYTFVYADVKDTKKGAKVELHVDGEFAPHIGFDCQEPEEVE